MRNSAYYARKVRRLFSPAAKSAPPPTDSIRLMLAAILQENAPGRPGESAMAALEQEFVDFNELRVSPVKDIVDVLGRNFIAARSKAEAITRALNVVFDRTNALVLEYLAKQPKRELRRLLREDLGLSPYAESVVTLYGFSGHAIPVDDALLLALKANGYIHPASDLADLQGFLERIIPAKDAVRCHEALREYVSRLLKRIAPELVRLEKAHRAAEAAQAARLLAQAAQARLAAAALPAPPPGPPRPAAPAGQAPRHAPKPPRQPPPKAPARPPAAKAPPERPRT
jgi:endonuclease-3